MGVWNRLHHIAFRTALGTKIKAILLKKAMDLPGIESLGDERTYLQLDYKCCWSSIKLL